MSSEQFIEDSASIPTGWTVKCLIDCTEDKLISYGIVQPGKHVENGIPILRVNNFRNGQLDLNDVLKVAPEVANKYKRTTLKGGEVLLTLVGSTGQSVVAPNNLAGWNVPRAIAVIRPNTEIGSNWINICLQSQAAKHFLDVRANTTVQKTLNLKDVRELPIVLPPENVRLSIEAVDTSLNEKIQLNHQINQTLEQMAQAIFKSWFVDFEPVKAKIAALEAGGSEEDALLAAMQAIAGDAQGCANAAGGRMPGAAKGDKLTRLQAEQPEQYAELRATAELFPSAMQDSELGEIPEGWGVDHLSELIQFNPRRSLKKGTLAPYLDMKNVPTSGHLADDVVLREMNSGTKFVNGDTLLARITPCLENGKTAYVDFLDSDQVGWGSTEYIVMRSQEPYPESISYFIARDESFRQHAIQSMTGTSGRQRANAKALAELPWIVFPHALAEAFDRISTPYLKLAKSHGNESKSLSAIRDAVLPKLLSGELSVSDAEDQLAEDAEPANV